MSKMKKLMTEEHKGYGGMYFLFTNILCAAIMMYCLQISYSSQVVAIADNLAYIASINTSAHYFLRNQTNSVDNYNVTINVQGRPAYNPLNDMNNMLSSIGIVRSGCTSVRVKWNPINKSATLAFNEFETKLGVGHKVRPHVQSSVIENK